uniref:Ig-like domain-containing protein n=1 Tax=Anolis carolinensis TaxID=28377 RepID=A0A803SPJ2_ANOCA
MSTCGSSNYSQPSKVRRGLSITENNSTASHTTKDMILWLKLLTLFEAFFGCLSQVLLVKKGGEGIVTPGSSLHLSCKAFGFTFTDYEMHWVRQAKGKGLEWVAGVSKPTGSSQWYNPKVKGRFNISRDNPQTSVNLQMNNLKPEDSGMYYCTRGTMVPSAFWLVQKHPRSHWNK